MNSGLVVRWPFENSVVDVVQGVALTFSNGVSYTQNHLGQSNSALAFSTSNYGTAPSNFYFYGGAFTISAWVKVNSMANQYEPILDFANGPLSNNVLFGFNKPSSQAFLRLLIWYGTTNASDFTASSEVKLKYWHFVTATHDGIAATLCVNVLACTTQTMNPPPYGNRTSNFVGNSNWQTPLTSTYVNDLRIYNRLLSPDEITALMNLGNMHILIQIHIVSTKLM